MTRSSTRTERAFVFEHRDDRLARLLAVRPSRSAGISPSCGLDDVRLRIEHVEHVGGLEPGALADLDSR